MDTNRENPHLQPSAPIVVGVDGSDGSDLAVRWTAEVAARRGRALHVVHGLDIAAWQSVLGSGYDVMDASAVQVAHSRGTEIVDDARRLALEVGPDLDVATEVSDASPARVLIHHSKTAHFVVLGATGSAGTFAHLGSTLLAVTSHGNGSVVVVRDTGTAQHIRHDGPVVVGVDGSPVSEVAIAAAFAEAADRHAGLVALHSWSDRDFGEFAGKPDRGIDATELESAEYAILAERLAGWQEKYPDVHVARKVYLAGPTGLLMQWSKSAQLIVVGSRGRGGFTGLLLGSTSNFLVQHAHCPVLIAHPA
ncbi:universal stress protein [Nocardia sp. NBC_01730]|uniref:universal stress protein n=1 Tax=Nocardia sp. NBC_01730 TaxID=2975998 RepID=UPI002E1547B3|nr:universal stress protein [Nocardia sp. NBC_01730]